MVYTVTEKKEQIAAAVLYGAGAKRFAFELQHTQANGKPDNITSTLYVDAATFAKYGIGDTVFVGIDYVMADAVAVGDDTPFDDEPISANGPLDRAERVL